MAEVPGARRRQFLDLVEQGLKEVQLPRRVPLPSVNTQAAFEFDIPTKTSARVCVGSPIRHLSECNKTSSQSIEAVQVEYPTGLHRKIVDEMRGRMTRMCSTPAPQGRTRMQADTTCPVPFGDQASNDILMPASQHCSTESSFLSKVSVEGDELSNKYAKTTTPSNDAPFTLPSTPTAVDSRFFAELNALQERMERRRHECKNVSFEKHKIPTLSRTSEREHSMHSSPESLVPLPLPTGLSPRADTDRQKVPQFQVQINAPTLRSVAAGSPMLRSEQRRRRSPIQNGPIMYLDEDEALKMSGNELLRWADEVLSQFAAAKSGMGTNTEPQRSTQMCAEPTCRAERRQWQQSRQRCSSNAWRPSQRAEEFRDKIRKLNEESEQDREWLIAETQKDRRFNEQDVARWRERVNSAANEMRSNFAHMSFDTKYDSGSATRKFGNSSGNTGGSMPPPRSVDGSLRTSLDRIGPEAQTGKQATHSWLALEALLECDGGQIHFRDIPWPTNVSDITGVLPTDTRSVAKRRLAVALRRWHPDKWRRILDHVPEIEREQVIERVKSIAQHLLDEKNRLFGREGSLH